jgi:hypothetical protein
MEPCSICCDPSSEILACLCTLCPRCFNETVLHGSCHFCRTEVKIIKEVGQPSPFDEEEMEIPEMKFSDEKMEKIIALYQESKESRRKEIEDNQIAVEKYNMRIKKMRELSLLGYSHENFNLRKPTIWKKELASIDEPYFVRLLENPTITTDSKRVLIGNERNMAPLSEDVYKCDRLGIFVRETGDYLEDSEPFDIEPDWYCSEHNIMIIYSESYKKKSVFLIKGKSYRKLREKKDCNVIILSRNLFSISYDKVLEIISVPENKIVYRLKDLPRQFLVSISENQELIVTEIVSITPTTIGVKRIFTYHLNND